MKKLISVILTFSLLLSFISANAAGINGSAMSRDELVANYKAVEQNVFAAAKSEYGYASYSSSSTLSWSASYALESYFQMYKNTGDVKYLKSLGLQLREAFSNLNYDYGEDKPGWDAPNYSVKRMPDPEFDKVFASATSKNSISTTAWMRKYGSDSKHVNVEDNAGVSGRGLHIVSGSGKTQGAEITIPEYAKGMVFQFSISAKNTAPACAYITDAGGNLLKTLDGDEYISFNSPSNFTSYTVRYTVPEDGGSLTIHLESSDANADGDIYFDTVAFQQAAQFHVHDTMVLAAAAKFIEQVYAIGSLGDLEFENGKTYKAIADEFLKITEAMIEKWDFCWREDGDIGVYVWPMDDSSSYPGNTLPHNQYIKMACVMMPLYEATGKPLYLDRALKMLNFFKQNLKTVGTGDNAYVYWNYYDPAFGETNQTSRVEDISHGCLELDAAIMAYERGLVFKESDMKKFANAFVKMLWNGDLENPVIYNYLMDDSKNSLYHKEVSSASNVRDWARLGKWNSDIAIAIVNYMANNQPTSAHTTKMLTYSYAYPYIFNELKWILIGKTSGAITQLEKDTETVEFSLKANPGSDEAVLDNSVWTVKKDDGESANIGTGKTASYKPKDVGVYTITASVGGKSTTYKITVEKDIPSSDEKPSGGSSGGGGGGSVSAATPDTEKESTSPEYNESDNSEESEKYDRPSKKFGDIKENDWYTDAVDHAIEKGIMSGVSDTSFEPNGMMTRAMLAKVLHNMEKNPTHSFSGKFDDVNSEDWYTDAVLWAAEMGIVDGYGNGKFGANDHITREQLAVMLWRYSGCRSSSYELSFDDAGKISEWALPAMRWAVENKVINGKSDTELSPAAFATRAEVAQMLKNYTENVQ